MTLVRCTPNWANRPTNNFTTFQRQMSRLLEDAFGTEPEETLGRWAPRVDLTEFDDHFELLAELPGLNIEDVKIELDNNLLAISGEKRIEANRTDRNVYLNERSFGAFRRNFQFPSGIDAAKIDAIFKNGILTITLPKAETARPKQIEIKAH